jgi:hypothetical protein
MNDYPIGFKNYAIKESLSTLLQINGMPEYLFEHVRNIEPSPIGALYYNYLNPPDALNISNNTNGQFLNLNDLDVTGSVNQSQITNSPIGSPIFGSTVGSTDFEQNTQGTEGSWFGSGGKKRRKTRRKSRRKRRQRK